MKFLFLSFVIASGLVVSSVAGTQEANLDRPADAGDVLQLYSGSAPGSERWSWHEEVSLPPWGGGGGRLVRNVVHPTLTVFKPSNALRLTHTAVIVAPGGGFRWLSIDSEGYDVARALAARGITAIVLKYRLEHTPDDESKFRDEALSFVRALIEPPVESKTQPSRPTLPHLHLSPSDNPGIADGIAAVRYVRHHTAELQVNRVGMLGFSAGGAVTIATILNGDEGNRLDFAAPIYGALNAVDKWPDTTPPMFLAVAADDVIANKGEIDCFSSLRTQGLSAELHVFDKGGHGFGLVEHGLTSDLWLSEFVTWLASKGFVSPS